MKGRHVVLTIALLLASCASGTSGAFVTPAPVPTVAPVTLQPPKIALRGLIDMQDISWHNTDNATPPPLDISNVTKYAGEFGGIVINAGWNQMQPSATGPLDFSVVETGLTAVRAYNAANPAAPLGIKLRIYAGSNAPQWAKNLPGGPITIYRNPAGCGGKTDTCVLTLGAFWTQPYIVAWRAFQAQVAAKYDAEPLIKAVAVTSCAEQTDEPFVASSGPISKQNLTQAHFDDAAQEACLTGAIDDYSAWQNTGIDFTVNSYNRIAGGIDTNFTVSVMTLCRQKIGSRCVLDNHGLQTPVTSDAAIYQAIAAAGAPINFQTQAPETMGCIWPETITQGLMLGARAIEVWPAAKFQGFDTLTVAQVTSLQNLFFAPVPVSTPVPNPLPAPCSGFN